MGVPLRKRNEGGRGAHRLEACATARLKRAHTWACPERSRMAVPLRRTGEGGPCADRLEACATAHPDG